ncbi:hypothetical protein OAH36_03265 [Verrucomicrobia bacterium]|jgi:hypothetical protein|nr:hypothetical protein [Verrucomicrobiota bacterium]
MSKWNGAVANREPVETITPSDAVAATGSKVKPRNAKPKRQATWVYLTPREQEVIEKAAIKAQESVSEFIRNAVRKRVRI